ncbi:MAG: arylsulfatase, partial [Mariniblastus sp.]
MRSVTHFIKFGFLCFVLAVSIADNSEAFDGSAASIAGENSESKKPNIIFILTDDLGWGDLGVLHQNESKHDRTHKTPFLDQMAADGMQLRAHYCPAPVCAPSRSSLLTGVHQGHAVIRNNQFDKSLENNHTLGTVMKSAGYDTVMIGKYGLQGLKADSPETWTGYPTKRGFDEFYGYVRHRDGHVHYPADEWAMANSEGHRNGAEVWWNDKEVSSGLQKCYTTDLFTAKSKQWIADHQTKKPETPFFLCLTYDTPHAALQVPTVEYPEGKGLKGGLQWIGEPGKMINTAVGEIDSYRHPDYADQKWTDVEIRFATMVRRIDNAVGDLLQTLVDLGIEENTMVVFTSDNGPHHESYINKVNYEASSFQSYGPFDGTKRDTWEGGIRMPTLVWWPKNIPAGKINNQPSQFHDWMTTMAAVAGISAPARADGVSLVPSLTGKGEQSASTIYIEYAQNGRTKPYPDFMRSRQKKKRGEMQVIHVDGFKGIRTDTKSHATPFEIYDLNADPGEENNLAGSSEKFETLQQKMLDRVLRLRIKNDSAKRPYDNEMIPGYETIAGIEPGDIKQRNFHGAFPHVPKVDSLEPAYTTLTRTHPKAITIGLSTTAEKPGAIEFETVLMIETAGQYELSFNCPTKGFVRVHEAGVLDADFGYKP